MTIEERVFRRARFAPAKAEAYGFRKTESGYEINIAFMDGDFEADVAFDRDGSVRGRVIDTAAGEEYDQLRNPRYTGAFVGQVREAYEEILKKIAEKCCDGAVFASGQANRIADLILEEYGISPDFPWEGGRYESLGVFRHPENRKWFALVMGIDRTLLDPDDVSEAVDVINLKIDPVDGVALRSRPGIFSAYHMNHKTWISVTLDDIMSDSAVMELVSKSFSLTCPGKSSLDEELIRKVLGIADSIPFGHVATYGQIARLAGREKNSRLVGKIMSMADRYGEHPCHRVVNASGRLVPGWTEQRGMLEAEGITFLPNGNVDIKKHRWDA